MSLLTDRLDPAALAAELDETGFVCIENAIDLAWVERAQAYVQGLVEQKGRRYFALNWLSRDKGTPPQELADDPRMRRVMAELAQIGCPRAKMDEEIYTGLRVVAGSTGGERSLLHHYDKHVIHGAGADPDPGRAKAGRRRTGRLPEPPRPSPLRVLQHHREGDRPEQLVPQPHQPQAGGRRPVERQISETRQPLSVLGLPDLPFQFPGHRRRGPGNDAAPLWRSASEQRDPEGQRGAAGPRRAPHRASLVRRKSPRGGYRYVLPSLSLSIAGPTAM